MADGVQPVPEARQPPPLRVVNYRSVAAAPDAVPRPLTALVGRAGETFAIRQLLTAGGVRLCTLTGPGGIGKTRLAIEIAITGGADFPDGVAYVSLAALTDPSLVLPAIANALGIADPGPGSLQERLARSLDQRRMLLVLDNFEHVAAAASSIAELLHRSSDLVVLVTSRSPLHISGEHEFAIPPLAVPEKSPATLQGLVESPAVALFEARARAVQRDFRVDRSNAETVLGICRRLGGVPLAIELAAARAKALPPNVLLERLGQRLDLLSGGPIDAPERHRTMRHAIGWSYGLLPPEQQRLFQILSLFAGGCSLDAAESVVAGFDNGDLLDGLAALVDASLVTQMIDAEGQPRYQMLTLIRDFGLDRLLATSDAAVAITRFADWTITFADRLIGGSTDHIPENAVDRLEPELDNIRAALVLLDRQGDASRLLQLVTLLEPLWFGFGHQREGMQWTETALRYVDPATPPRLVVRATLLAARLATTLGRFDDAATYVHRAATLAKTSEDEIGLADAACILGNLARGNGDQHQARQHYEAALARYRALGSRSDCAYTLLQLGKLGDFGIPNRPGDPKDLHVGTARATEALELYRALPNRLGIARALNQLGYLAYKSGNYPLAASHLAESLGLFRSLGNLPEASQSIETLADIAGATNRPALAARLYGTAEGIQNRFGTPMWPAYREEYELEVQRVRSALDPDRFAAEWAAGLDAADDLGAEAALQAAGLLAAAAQHPPPASPDPVAPLLTSRETEVLALLATGASNRAIADALFISVTTVKGHVQNIMRKLEIDSRTGLAAYATRHGLVAPS